MMDARSIKTYSNTPLQVLVDAVDRASRGSGAAGCPWSEAVLYTAARRLEQLISRPRTVELPSDCWLPAPDVEWFREPGTGDPHYRPISEQGHQVFKGYEESQRYPGSYGFRAAMPDTWPHLTFAKITPPEPRW